MSSSIQFFCQFSHPIHVPQPPAGCPQWWLLCLYWEQVVIRPNIQSSLICKGQFELLFQLVRCIPQVVFVCRDLLDLIGNDLGSTITECIRLFTKQHVVWSIDDYIQDKSIHKPTLLGWLSLTLLFCSLDFNAASASEQVNTSLCECECVWADQSNRRCQSTRYMVIHIVILILFNLCCCAFHLF